MTTKLCTRIMRFYVVIILVACLSAATAYASTPSANGRADAHETRVISLQETATMRLTRTSVTFQEAEGRASGTIRGHLHLRIDVETASQMSALFSGSAGSSTLTGNGGGHYTVSGSIFHFTGTSKIVRGTGSFAHASGSVRIEGTLNRLKGTIVMAISGQIRVPG
jgi:hypothetical protein